MKHTVKTIQAMRDNNETITMLTAYDFPTAKKVNDSGIDMILVEGYKDIRFPKIELHRAELGKPFLYPGDDSIIALACNAEPPGEIEIPVLDINDIEAFAAFICEDFLNRD